MEVILREAVEKLGHPGDVVKVLVVEVDNLGRINLSRRALVAYSSWFMRVCLDQVAFMTQLFELDALARRLRDFVERSDRLRPEAARLLEEALLRGQFERGARGYVSARGKAHDARSF